MWIDDYVHQVHEGAVNAASKLWQSSSLPAPAVPSASEDEMKHAVVVEAQRNTANLQSVYLIHSLTFLLQPALFVNNVVTVMQTDDTE